MHETKTVQKQKKRTFLHTTLLLLL